MNRSFFVILLLVAAIGTKAQIHEIGVFAGGSNYIGDVGATDYIAPNELALGILYKWNRSPRHSWRASYTYGKITGSDAEADSPGRKQRGYEFENSVKELSLGLEFNFFDFNLHEPDLKITPYVYSGLSYFRYDDKYIRDGREYTGDAENGFAIPMTVGIKTNIVENFIIGFEVGARYTFTDNLDGSNPGDDAYKQYSFGNLESNDWYVFSGFTLTYTFGNKPCYCAN